MIEAQAIADVLLISPPRFADQRGWFSESWNQAKLASLGFHHEFVQDNHSYSAQTGTIRGLHCQVLPFVQGKLVRCVRGSIWDVAIDIRKGSPDFGKFVAAELSAANGRQLVEQCRATHPDLIVTDIKMPDMDGIDAAQAICADRPLPIILVSAYHDPELVKRAEADHVLAYL
ncbi:MAG: hypothetical protein B7X01_03735, partial [Acidiphilium sp. 21-62-4]